HRHGHAEDIAHHLLGRTFGQAIGPGTQRYGGVDARTVGPTGNALGPGCPCGRTARGAHQLMPLILGNHRLDRGNLEHLMPKRRRIVPHEGCVATTTPLRFEDDHLIDLFHRPEGTCLARMARLPPTTTLPPEALWALRLRRIARRRA